MRAGTYVKQATGYKAFIPKPLPPADPELDLSTELLTYVSKADRALGRLDGSIQTLPDPNLFVFMYVRKEAVLSSQIEGTQSSLTDVLEAESSIYDPKRPKDVKEVINYIKAMNYGLEKLKELPISVRLIREIHEKLLSGTRGAEHEPGELRRTQNWIGPQGCSLNTALYVPPPPYEMGLALSELEKFIHSENKLPLLVKIGLIHAQFETIHPFLDGNGRVGRLLNTFMLCEQEVILKPVLYLSVYFKKNRQEYYDRLQAVRDDGDWEAWLKFFLTGIYEVSQEATVMARNIVVLREKQRKIVQEHFGRTAANGMIVLEKLYSQPMMNIQDIIELVKVSYPAASSLMEKFVKYGILTEITGRTRNRLFRFADYITLFA